MFFVNNLIKSYINKSFDNEYVDIKSISAFSVFFNVSWFDDEPQNVLKKLLLILTSWHDNIDFFDFSNEEFGIFPIIIYFFLLISNF